VHTGVFPHSGQAAIRVTIVDMSQQADPISPAARFARAEQGRLIGGVASGLAAHLRLTVLAVRIAFAVLSAINGFGVVLYLALWWFTPTSSDVRTDERTAPAGLAAHERSGLRTSGRLRGRGGDVGQLVALVLVAVGLALLVQGTSFGFAPQVTIPILVAAGGVVLVWFSADTEVRRRSAIRSPKAPWLGAIVERDGKTAVLQMVLGCIVVGFGLLLFLAGQGELGATLNGLAGLLVLLLGVGLVAAPWIWQAWQNLQDERRARIVNEERADVAAHLHDSVLQTLALIQKQANDPREVVRLARAQERDLRAWLYEEEQDTEQSLAAALRRAAAEVEERHGIPVEVVTVGDGAVDDAGSALLRAAREAIVNAAKHSGALDIDVYLEAASDGSEIFIRDRGAGFSLDDVPVDRLGVRGSIVGRMERHGGQARIRSTPGEGTEVWLTTRGEGP